MHVAFTLYNQSPLANFVKLSGIVLALTGILMIKAQEYLVSAVLGVVGIGLLILASIIHKHTRFNRWIKKLNEQGSLDQISESEEVAMSLYRANPTKQTLKWIGKHNPEAEKKIKEAVKATKMAP